MRRFVALVIGLLGLVLLGHTAGKPLVDAAEPDSTPTALPAEGNIELFLPYVVQNQLISEDPDEGGFLVFGAGFILESQWENDYTKLSYVWDMPHLRGERYSVYGTDPIPGVVGADTYVWALKELLKRMDMGIHLLDNHAGSPYFQFYNVATNDPKNTGANDSEFPPAFNLITYATRPYADGVNGHFFPEENGRLNPQRTWYAWHVNCDSSVQIRRPGPDRWMPHYDSNCAVIYEERVTSAGELQLRYAPGASVYTLSAHSPTNINVYRDDILIFTVERSLRETLYGSSGEFLEARVVFTILDYAANLRITETMITYDDVNGTLADRTYEEIPLDGSAPTATATPISTATATATSTPTPIPTGVLSFAASITYGDDDVEQQPNGNMFMNSTDLELLRDVNTQLVGLRFNNVDIPPGAEILSAQLAFTVDETRNSDPSLITVRGEMATSSAPFSTQPFDVANRPLTAAAVDWSPPRWTAAGVSGIDQQTPNLAAILQEVVDQGGWQPGNSLALILSGTGRRVAESFEGGGEANAPRLIVQYRVPVLVPTATPTPTETPQPTETATSTPTETPQPTETATSTPTETSLPTETATSTPTETPLPTETATSTPTETSLPTETATSTPTETPQPTETATSTPTETSLPTETATSTPTETPQPTETTTPTATPTDDASGAGEIFSLYLPIAAAEDDAEESGSGSIYTNSSDLELTHDGTLQTIGLRFRSVTVPAGATILGAYVEFTVDETRNIAATSLNIYGEESANASSFVLAPFNISTRTRTAASVQWTPPLWTTIGAAGPDQQTPDLSAILQEIVDLPGWQSGNAIALIFNGTGRRVAESYEGSPAQAPRLWITYTTSPGQPTATSTATAIATATPTPTATVTATPLANGDIPTTPNFTVAYFADSGDGTNGAMMFDEVLQLVRDEGAQMVVHAGDFINNSGRQGITSAWVNNVNTILGPDFLYLGAEGNHDVWSDFEPFMRDRLTRNGYDPTLLNGPNYTLSHNGIKFVTVGEVLDSNVAFLQQHLSGDKHIWKVCVWHHQMNDTQPGNKINERLWAEYQTCQDNGAMITSGHEHSYARTLTFNEPVHADGQHTTFGNAETMWVEAGSPGKNFVVVSGLGGHSKRAYRADMHDDDSWWATLYTADRYCRNNCTNPVTGVQDRSADIAGYNYTYGALFVTYYVDGDPYKARAYFKTIDGNIIDSFEIYAGSPSSPAPTPTPTATATPIPSGQARTIAVPIAQGMDDVEEQQSGGIYTNSTDLELVQDSNVQTVGLRFQNVDLPPGATVTNAYVQFTTDATRSLSVNALTVAAERTAHAAPFTTAINNVSARTRTNTTVAWSPPLWTTINEAGPGQRTPDLSLVVQEIIDLPGWQSGNAIAVIVTGEGRREAYSFEGNPARAPVLYVEYLTP